MKLTPFAKLFITVVILAVIGYAAYYYKGADIRKWAVGDKAAGPPASQDVNRGDFDALGSAPADPARNAGATGVTGMALSGAGKLNAAAGGRHQHLGRPRARRGVQRRPRRQPGVELPEALRLRREVRPAGGSGGQAGGVPQRRHRRDVEHRRQLGARGVDPRRAEPEGEVDHHAGLVAGRRRHRLGGDDQVDRGPEGEEDRVHAVHAVPLPAALPPVAVGAVGGGPGGAREEHHLHPGCAGGRRDVQGEAGGRGRHVGAGPLRGGDRARRRGPRARVDHGRHQHHRGHAVRPPGRHRPRPGNACATSCTAGSRASR